MTWNADLYRERHAFVWQHGAGLLDWLEPRAGESVVDLGCGTGQLTAQIAAAGARVLGLDAAPSMIEAARSAFPQLTFEVADAKTFTLPEPADAVFSNAALHWITPPQQAAQRVAAALKPGGRFVAELGGQGNVQAIVGAVARARAERGLPPKTHPWFFPSLGEYAALLEDAGLRVVRAELFERPTRLAGEDGFQQWLAMFAQAMLSDLAPEVQQAVVGAAERGARPALFREGAWWADYVRLRILALKP